MVIASKDRWADYSAGYPGAQALKNAGFAGAIRYIGIGSQSKRITNAEYKDFMAHGLGLLLVAEATITDAWGGYSAGRANAAAARADARSRGIPDSVPILAAADSHAANQAQINAAVEYGRGFHDVLGDAGTGFYGFTEVVSAVRNAGWGSIYWRCGSQPTDNEKAWTHFWQRNAAPTVVIVNGIQIDINERYLPVNSAAGGFLMTLSDADQAELLAAARIIRDQITGGINADGSLKGWAGIPGKPDGTLIDMVRYAARIWADRYPSRVKDSTVTMTLLDCLVDTNAFTYNTLNNTIDLKAQSATGGVDVAALAASLAQILGSQLVTELIANLEVSVSKKAATP